MALDQRPTLARLRAGPFIIRRENIMKFKRIFSVIVCLVLVCSLVIGVSPIRAKAVFLWDDLTALAIGIGLVAILGVGGVVFHDLTDDGYTALGHDFLNFSSNLAHTDAEWDQLENWVDTAKVITGGGDEDPWRLLPIGGMGAWFASAVAAWVAQYVDGSKGVDVPVVVSGPSCGQLISAGTSIPYGWQTKYGINTFTCSEDVYFWGTYTDKVSSSDSDVHSLNYVSYVVCSSPNTSFTISYGSNTSYASDKISYNGKNYYWTFLSSSGTMNIADYPDLYTAFKSSSAGRIENSANTFSITDTFKAFLQGTYVFETPFTSVSPFLVSSPVIDYVSGGGDPEDVVLPDLELGNIDVEEGMTFPEAVQSLLDLLANGVITWEQYMEIVAPGQQITTSNGQVITQDGVQSDLTLPNLLTGIKTLLGNLANTILDGIKAIFVPSEDFITAKVDALAENFAFGKSVVDTAQFIGASLSSFEAEPPVIYAELQNSEGDIYWGERVAVLDLRWYERYKPTVDVIISAFMFLFFAWRVFIHLPNIISGGAGDGNIEKSIPVFRGYASDQRRLPHSGFFTHRDP